MNGIGINLGASNISIVKIAKETNEIITHITKAHEGNVKKTLKELLADCQIDKKDKVSVTGRKFKSLLKLPEISEAQASELAYEHLQEKYGLVEAIVSAGGETFIVYELDQQGKIKNVYTGNKCASGTGEFFLQQLKRINMPLNEALSIANINEYYHVSGRCSVFCKSDCTHALNKGEKKAKIIAGLCKMMGDKIIELLNKCEQDNILLIGGTSQNDVMVRYLRKKLNKVIVPKEACYFEALGAAIYSFKKGSQLNLNDLFQQESSSFKFLPALQEYKNKVSFHSLKKGQVQENDPCILGIDVGSTTTKAIIMRETDDSILASVYLRTNGDPCQAAQNCYQQLNKQVQGKKIKIKGLGVTGSGRQIVGLQALTDAVFNEIMAHATAAIYFDPEVDTIFEIGGQDAKYTSIYNKVPIDYAMNEACSAGTGSFLEEAAKETLDIEMKEIEEIALKSIKPPNFNDQCSAFISSDIKTAIQEGIAITDICAGLVYSICLNYLNRVKGNRKIGNKVFMQGGVCYNKAVPLAMAALSNKEIIVPPEPGLMGAFGVALLVKEHLSLGLIKAKDFQLELLENRKIKYAQPFICQGEQEKCDRRCKINLIEIEGEKYPFGGACNKYININNKINYDLKKLDLVKYRQKLIFNDFFKNKADSSTTFKGTIGLNRSLSIHSLLPLFSCFFSKLGYDLVLPKKINDKGKQKAAAAFCYPIEISHGYMEELISLKPDYIFLPHIKGLYVENCEKTSTICPMAQGEPYYLSALWPQLKKDNVLKPILDFKKGYEQMEKTFIKIGKALDVSVKLSKKAYREAIKFQEDFTVKLKEKGQEVLSFLENNPDKKAMVCFARPYNGFVSEVNMSIPQKFASRGELILPFDMLPYSQEKIPANMYWSLGQKIMQAAQFVSSHPQLFAAYITNFSCGPDSFILSYFREVNGSKPSLTLELDSHTADAGLDTRIEAFIDVVESYGQLKDKEIGNKLTSFSRARIESKDKKLVITDSKGKCHSLYDQKIKVLIPSMGGIASHSISTALKYCGVNVSLCDPPGEEELKLGRANSTSKECLPLQLTLGSLLKYLEQRENKDEILVYFMPETSGPCRFGQYNVLINNIITKKKIKDVVLLSLTSENSYASLGQRFSKRAWQGVMVTDSLTEISSVLLALSKDKNKALEIFKKSCQRIYQALATQPWSQVKKILRIEAKKLAKLKLKKSYQKAKKVLLTGEIYVRSDQFSRQNLVEKLAKKEIVTKVTPNAEWFYYVDYLYKHGLTKESLTLTEKLKFKLQSIYKQKIEKEVKEILAETKLYQPHLLNIEEIINNGEKLISPQLTGEAILTIGGSLTEIIKEVDGVIAIGPFACMPHRVAEGIISKTLLTEKQNIVESNSLEAKVLSEISSLPFLSIETDGSVFPQVIEARLEAFCLQVTRINQFINKQKIK